MFTLVNLIFMRTKKGYLLEQIHPIKFLRWDKHRTTKVQASKGNTTRKGRR